MVGEVPLPLLLPTTIDGPPAHPSTTSSLYPLPAHSATCPFTPPPTPTQPSAHQFTYLPTLQRFILTSTFLPTQAPVHLLTHLFTQPNIHLSICLHTHQSHSSIQPATCLLIN